MVRIQNAYDSLSQKRKKSIIIYLFINITQIILTALVVILNLYLVRKNVANTDVKWIFIVIAILTAITSAVSSFMSLMVFRKKSKVLKEKQHKILSEFEKFKLKSEEYEAKDADETLIRKVNEILRRD